MKQSQNITRNTFLLATVIGLAFLFAFFVPVDAAFNPQINYQGKLTNRSNVAVPDGTYNMAFSMYTVASGGSAVWTETRTNANRVQVTNGLFTVMLGSVNPLTGVDFDQTLYLGVTIGGSGDTPTWDLEMSPRKPLGAVPAAFVAQKLQGLTIATGKSATISSSLTFAGTDSTSFTFPTSSGTVAITANNLGVFASTTSVQLAGVISNETGTAGNVVFSGNPTLSGLTMADNTNIVLNATTGTRIGTATTQKLGFFNATPVVQPSGNVMTALANLGLVASPTLADADIPDTITINGTNNVSWASVNHPTTISGYGITDGLTTATSFTGGDIASGVYNNISLVAGITRDTEWDTAAKINAATTDADFSLTTHTHSALSQGTGIASFSYNGGSTATVGLDYTATLAGNPTLAANLSSFATTGIIFEGATADLIEGLLTVADPTGSDVTWTLPNVSGTVVVAATSTTTTQALFATSTAGAPAYRAIADADIPDNITITSAGSATNATNIGITNDISTNATMYPVWVTANTGNLPAKVTSTKLSYNPSTGVLTSTGGFSGNATTASALAADPTDCAANTWATTIASNGNLTCAAVTYAGITAMTSANFATIISDETGTAGNVVLSTNPTLSGLTMADNTNIVLNATTGTRIGTATTQKLGFFNATPVVQPSGNVMTALTNLGLVASPTLADADIPDGITLTNLTQITTRNHHDLQGLSDDDHTIYALLAGRSGGQSLIGGTAANNVLTLQANSATGNTATNAAIQLKVGDSGSTTALTVYNSGNVAIGGALAASGRLHVYGDGTNPALFVNGGDSAGILLLGSTSTVSGNGIRMLGNSTNGGTSSIYSDYYGSEGALVLGTYSNRSNQLFLATNGSIGIGNASPGAKLDVTGAIRTNNQLISTVPSGTAPLSVSSNTVVPNLNADLLDGNDSSYFLNTSAGSQTKSGDLTVNNMTANRFYQNANGVPTNNLGTPSVTEMALFDEQFNNKTAFYNINNLKFYTFNGSTWTEYTGFSDTDKRRFLGGDTDSSVNIPNLTQRFRVELNNDGSYVYLNALYMYWSSNSHSTQVQIWKKDTLSQAWSQVTSSTQTVSSWPGHLYLPFPTIAYLNSATGSHADAIRIEFIPTWSGHPTYGNNPINLFRMQIWGGYPAGKRNIYTTDEFKNVTFPASLNSLARVGVGTASPGSALDVIMPGNANVYENGLRVNRPDSQGQYAFVGYNGGRNAYFGSVYTGSPGIYGEMSFRQYTQGMSYRDAMFIQTDGNIGIGTTSPELKLHVSGATGLPATSGTSQTGILRLGYPSGNGVLDFGSNAGNGWIQATNQTDLSQTYPLLLNPNGGNVGVGTTGTPSYRLTVNGDAQVTATLRTPYQILLGKATTADNASPGIVSATGDDFLYNGLYLNHYGFGFHDTTYQAGAGWTGAYMSGYYGLDLFTAGASRISVLQNGNVGIGTTTPGSFKLNVNGNTNITGNLTLTALGTADNTTVLCRNSSNQLAGCNSLPYLSSSASSTQAGYFGDIYLYDDSTPSHYLQITNSANLTAARTLSINTNDANRTITLSGNPTLSDWFDQSVKQAATPTFAGLNTTSQWIGDATSKFWIGPSAGNNYIESGNAAWNASATMYLCGYNCGSLPNLNVISTNSYFSGNVGIGISTAGAQLHVAATTSGSSWMYGESITSTITSTANGTVGLNIAPTMTPATGSYGHGIYIAPAISVTSPASVTASGIWIEAASKSGTGTVSTAYGIYVANQSIGTANWGVYSAGTNSNYFNGNVTIGTTAASQKLEVQGPAGSPASSGTTQNGIMRVTNSTNNLALDFGQMSVAPHASWIQNSDKISLGTSYPLALNPVGGNVGVGTTTPLTKLQVGADYAAEPITLGSLTPELLVMGAITNTTDDSLLRLVRPAYASNLYPASVDFKVKSFGALGAPYNAKTQLTLGLKDNASYDSSAVVDVMTLRSDGTVGIGTTSPTHALQVLATSAGAETVPFVIQNSDQTANTAVTFRMAATNAPDAAGNGLINFTNTRQSDGSSDLNILISPGASAAPTTRLFVDGSSGNLGIGTTSTTTYKLNVNGTINAEGNYLYFGNAGYLRNITSPYAALTTNVNVIGRDATDSYIYYSGDSNITGAYVLMYGGSHATNAGQMAFTGTKYTFNTGSVGIGADAGVYKLNVNGNTYLNGNVTITGTCTGCGGGGSQWTTSGSNIYYNSTGNVGIGVNPTDGKLHTLASGGYNNTYFDAYADVGASVMMFRRARGTSGAPTAIDGVRQLGYIGFQGWDGTSFQTGATISSNSEGVFNGTTRTSSLIFQTVSGTTTNTALTITGAGKVHVGSGATTSIDANLKVLNSSSAYINVKAGTSPEVFLGSDASTYGIVGTYSNHPLGFRANNLLKMTVDNVSGTQISTQGSNSTYGALTILGSTNGWSGINFKNSSGSNQATLMVSGDTVGFYNTAVNGWLWYWSGGTLSTGTIPWANISGEPDFLSQSSISTLVMANGYQCNQQQGIAFGHSGVSEDCIGYNNNQFSFTDSPGGGDSNDPYVYMPGGYGSDYAELIPVRGMVQAGYIVSADNLGQGKAKASVGPSVIGVISTHPSIVIDDKESGTHIGYDAKPEYVDEKAPLALAGRVPVVAFNVDGKFENGTMIGSSFVPGVGRKPVTSGDIVGTTIESLDYTTKTCPAVSSFNEIVWPEDNGMNPDKPCFKVPVESFEESIRAEFQKQYAISTGEIYVGKVMILVKNFYYNLATDQPMGIVGESGEFQPSTDPTQAIDQAAYLQLTVESENTFIAPVHVARDILPTVDLAVNLGSQELRFGTIFVENIRAAVLVANNWSITEDGKLTAKEISAEKLKIAGDKTVGFGRIKQGMSEVAITNTNVTAKSMIFLTFLTNLDGRTYYVADKTEGQDFRVALSQPAVNDTDFQYWIVESDLDYQAFVESQRPAVEQPEPQDSVVEEKVPEPGATAGASETPVAPEEAPQPPADPAPVVQEAPVAATVIE